ncbi:MAG: CbtA family protein [Ilumatobacter sp.]|uniref:CbtA family protein n=1 Tax=Ilumatobacter sp. TaxID=1967498 RepID=UPI0039191D4C
MRRLIEIALASGLAAGVAIATFTSTVGRGPLDDALALEESLPHDHGGAGHEALMSRGVQEVGGLVGLVLFGLALGLIFMVVWAKVSKHLPARTSIASTMQLGAIGFVTVVLVPFVKYPANPPAVGDPSTVDERTVQYLAVVAMSIVLTIVVWQVRRRLSTGSDVRRAWLSTAAYAAGLAVIAFVLPESPDVVEAPTDLVWRFRLASLGALATGWLVLSLASGTLLSGLERPAGQASPADEPDLVQAN